MSFLTSVWSLYIKIGILNAYLASCTYLCTYRSINHCFWIILFLYNINSISILAGESVLLRALYFLLKNKNCLNQYFKRNCCPRLGNIQRSKNYFTQDRTTQAVVITKKQNLHTVKRRPFTVQHRFYFVDIRTTKKVIRA